MFIILYAHFGRSWIFLLQYTFYEYEYKLKVLHERQVVLIKQRMFKNVQFNTIIFKLVILTQFKPFKEGNAVCIDRTAV